VKKFNTDKIQYYYNKRSGSKLWVRVMVFNATLKQYVNYMVAISFIHDTCMAW